MRSLRENDYLLLRQLCAMTQKELKKTLSVFLKSKYDNVVETEDYLYACGEIPVALCAHMDTVFPKPPTVDDIYYDRQRGVIWSPLGLGADDRAGVYAIIQIINKGLRPHIIFTTDEEKGCIGASVLANINCPFEDLRYIIQLDRRGRDDCVFYECNNKESVEYVESFGFVEDFGTFSDIYELCPSWGIAGVNLSIGYESEHSVSEILHVGPMLNTIEKVTHMLSEDEIPYFKFIMSKYGYMYWSQYYKNQESGKDWNVAYGYGPDDDDDFAVICHDCRFPYDYTECVPVTADDGHHYYLCLDCLGKRQDIEWCTKCGEAFEMVGPDDDTCIICKGEKNKDAI